MLIFIILTKVAKTNLKRLLVSKFYFDINSVVFYKLFDKELEPINL